MMLRLEGVSKCYESTHAVRQTDLLIEAGQTTVLIGPSGCGKSTLLRAIAGLQTLSAGQVEILGGTAQAAQGIAEAFASSR